jgi:hypothetical protein
MNMRNVSGELDRGPFQGVWNIIRFNYEFFIFSFFVVAICGVIAGTADSGVIILISSLIALGTLLATLASLVVSWFIYDRSPLYSLRWLDSLLPADTQRALNIHAGFDETSQALLNRYPGVALEVIDFYDPLRHTERSIRRARASQPVFPGTKSVAAADLRLPSQHYQAIFLILAVHEIRERAERVAFLEQLKSALTPNGALIVVEHARDLANFCAYSIGFFHFLPLGELQDDFTAAGLKIKDYSRITPFVHVYCLANS